MQCPVDRYKGDDVAYMTRVGEYPFFNEGRFHAILPMNSSLRRSEAVRPSALHGVATA